MKRFTKTLLSVAAVSAVSAAMAVSAMAMSATYADGKVTFSNITDTGASQTLLILNKDATTVAEGDIVQIDQKDNNENFNGVAVPVGELADGTYYVRIGGTNCPTLQTFTLEVKSTSVETKEIVIGDASGDKQLKSGDSTMILRYVGGSSKNHGDTGIKYKKLAGGEHIVGDANGDGFIKSGDSTMVLRYVGGSPKNKGNVDGTPITVEATPVG